MRSLLLILAIAIVAIGISLAVTDARRHGRLNPAPQIEDAEKEMANELNAKVAKTKALEAFAPNREGAISGVMMVKGSGKIAFELYPAEAPKTVAHLVKLIGAGCYNGQTVASMTPGESVAIDAMHTATPAQSALLAVRVPQEKNKLQNVTGSMALELDKAAGNTGSSRFYINLKANHAYDPMFPVFGKVVSGLDVAQKLTAASVIEQIAVRAPVKNPYVEMSVAGRGKALIELYPQDAPKTVAHFLALCRSGFYKGLLFHRVRPGFIVQAGDPATRNLNASDVAGATDSNGVYSRLGIGNGGSGSPVPFEENSLTHEPGCLSLALTRPHTATGDSQFFIDLVRNPLLDGGYCVFGRVVQGMDVVQKIQQGDRIAGMKVLKAPPAPSH